MMTATVRSLKTAAEEGFAHDFAASRADLPGLARERAAAFALFDGQGLPHRRVEEWKWSDLRGVMREAKPTAGAPRDAAQVIARTAAPAFPGLEAPRAVLVDGWRVAPLDAGTLPKGIELRDLADALARGDRLLEAHFGRLHRDHAESVVELNAALFRSGAILHVDAGRRIEAPIHLDWIFATDDVTVLPRVLIVLGDGAEATVIESVRGPSKGLQVNAVTEIVIGKGGRLNHVKLQAQSDDAVQVASTFVEIAADAAYETFTLQEGAAFAREQLFVRFIGEESAISLAGATMATGRQHLDTTLVVDHAVPGCVSRETYKYILGGEAEGVFQGKIIVRPDAQKTDGRMSARALLLEEGAEFDAKPELEIYADDVQCAHGATAGELDEDLMFYLQARGIPEAEAKALLIKAFVGEALEEVGNEHVRVALENRISDWLARSL
jgi:Fe-S cluster assembly protein SufD